MVNFERVMISFFVVICGSIWRNIFVIQKLVYYVLYFIKNRHLFITNVDYFISINIFMYVITTLNIDVSFRYNI